MYGTTGPSTIAPVPAATFKGNFGCKNGANNLTGLINSPNLYEALLPYVTTCPVPKYKHKSINATCPVVSTLSPGGPVTSFGEIKT
jgi:hypothetical protein